MIKRLIVWFIWIIAFIGLAMSVSSVPASPVNASSNSMVSPDRCPLGGCAAGQRLNFQTSFDLLRYSPSPTANIQVCLYTPANWAITEGNFETFGKLSGAIYSTNTDQCGPAPTDYVLVSGVTSALNLNYFGDTLDFYFRLGKTATNNGSTLIRVYERDTVGWALTEQSFNFIAVAPTSNTVFVAKDASTCGTNSPCYINSKDDLASGLGTGLKDAVDVVDNNSSINIIGVYPIKSNTVQIDKPLTIQGINNSSITSDSLTCSQPILLFRNKNVVKNLSIDDGFCILQNRDLLVIDSTEDIEILSSTLSKGNDAIRIINNLGKINIQFNNITGNTGYAINKPVNSGSGQLMVTANNILNNRTGAQITCGAANLGLVDHNYWGIGVLPANAAPDCTSQSGKRLGSAIIDNLNSPGVQAQIVTVTSTKQQYFENSIAVQRPLTNPVGSDFNIYIVNHGNNASNTPFLSSGSISTLVPCSNYFDIFLTQGTTDIQELNIFLKYDLNSACVANIESTTYCGQSNPALYPLWWYDPDQLITTGWNTTGQNPNGPSATGANGQVTTCNSTNKEISVQVDTTGRPGLLSDLNFTPFVIGLIGQPASAVLTNFSASPGDMQVTINWSTASELNTSGFYVQRRQAGTSIFNRISPFIVHTGSASTGANYSLVDNDVVNLIGYEYRLEIIGTNLLSVYSNIISATPRPPTPTSTRTSTSTITLTPTITQTPTITLTPTITTSGTITITTTPTITATRTITLTPTRTRFQTATNTRTPFIIPYRSPTRTTFNVRETNASYPVPTSGSANPTSGYPVPQPGSTQSAGEEGYPQPQSSSQPQEGYPEQEEGGNQITASPNVEESENTPVPGRTSISKPTTQNKPGGQNQDTESSWVYPLLGSIIGLSLVLLVGYFLWKKGYLALPFLPNGDDADNSKSDHQ